MDNLLGPGTTLGYCTNVHAGANWGETRQNLEKHALQVKRAISPDTPMGIGLWLSARSARDVIDRVGIDHLKAWLDRSGLNAFTFNGFPHGDFHQPKVKKRVYQPNWGETARLDYTFDLIEILSGLMEDGQEGSISTLPLGWGKGEQTEVNLEKATTNLLSVADHLRRLEDETGKLIHLNLEPEPGCYLDRHEDVTAFFKERLLAEGDEKSVLRHLRVCHDICHSAVMFEDQREAFEAYSSLGVRIGKVQISSAIRIDLERMAAPKREVALEQLGFFQEDRYLHQTVARCSDGEWTFYEDLPEALEEINPVHGGEVRVHFHVPLFLEETGAIGTTQPMVIEGMKDLLNKGDVHHYEVETYAWGVLPENLRTEELAEGIAREMTWVKENFQQ
ncbi:MAG: metabolite traffic protein EboE [Candidatus Omnitrophica bacterium]|nr:metabolite traffic protein EboE [Candidatus Omnitrophota bacterium]